MTRNDKAASADRPGDGLERDTDRHDEDRDTDRDDGHTTHGANPGGRGKWISALIALLGFWIIVQTFGVELTVAQFWNDILVGTLLIGVGGYNYSQRSSERFGNTAVAMIAVAAGLWLIAAPFVLGGDPGITETGGGFALYNDIVVGLLAAGLGAYSAHKARDHQHDTSRTTT